MVYKIFEHYLCNFMAP